MNAKDSAPLVHAPFNTLEPRSVWAHFQTLCDTPRPSKHEAAIRDRLADWGRARGLTVEIDPVGNLILRKAAAPGREKAPGVVLQGHLDMVCQQNGEGGHDFHRDPIQAEVEDGWLLARHTTLGADNGLGVALALAALEADDLDHGPLEALFTVDEEAGMGGALGLAPGRLEGRYLLNIDTEEWGQLYLGCAGGVDVNVNQTLATRAPAPGEQAYRITLAGLVGGHSGIDIHKERGNAIKLLVRLLAELTQTPEWADLGLAVLIGGAARNALPREARARVVLAGADRAAHLQDALARYQALFREELAGVDGGLTLTLEAVDLPQRILENTARQGLLAALGAAPHGVRRWSQQLPGVVETSNNLGVLALREGEFSANFMVRSLRDSGSRALAGEIAGLFRLAGAQATIADGYAAWQPNATSPLVALAQEVYAKRFGAPAQVQVIHAGLECGIIGAKYPDLDMISFGPTIRGAHAPGERVEIATVDACWTYLKDMLAALAARTN